MATTTTLGNNNNSYDNFTPAALADELTLILSSKLECAFEETNNHLILSHPYLEQAERLIRRIRVYRHPSPFVIKESDIPDALVKHLLKEIDEFEMNQIITGSVRRLYESVDHDYFHINGLYDLVQWRFEE